MADLLQHYPIIAPENLRRQQSDVGGSPISVYSAFDFVGYPIKQDVEFNFDPLNPPVNGANVINSDMRRARVTLYPKSAEFGTIDISAETDLVDHLKAHHVYYTGVNEETHGAGQGQTFGQETSFRCALEPTGYTDIDVNVDFFDTATLSEPTVSAGGRGGDHFAFGSVAVEQITASPSVINYLYRNSGGPPFYLENSDLLTNSLNSISTFAAKFNRYKFVFVLILIDEVSSDDADKNDEAESKYQSAIDSLFGLGVDAELVTIPGPLSSSGAALLAVLKTRAMAFFS